MQRKKQAWAVVAVIMTLIGGNVERLHPIGSNPGTFFALGALATLSVLGIRYGYWDGRHVVRSGKPMSD